MKKHIDDLRIELVARLVAQRPRGLFLRQRRAVWAFGSHRIVGIGRRHDARSQGDLMAAQPVGVPFAVKSLVMMVDDRDQGRERASP